MDELKVFIKALPDDEAREAFAVRCKSTLGHIKNVMYGTRFAAPELAAALERETGGAVRCERLRPDLIWRRLPDETWPWHSEGRPLFDALATLEAPGTADVQAA
jgi:hypothetical protein